MKKILIIAIILMLVSISIVSNVTSISIKNEVKLDNNVEILNEPPRVWHELDPAEPNGKNDWYTECVTVSLFAEDEDGIDNIFCNYCCYDRYEGPFNVCDDQKYNIYYYAIDKLGQESDIKSIKFKVDKTKPYVKLTKKVISPLNIEFTAECSDYQSGIRKIDFFVDGVASKTFEEENWKCTRDWIWEGIGRHKVKVIVYDEAGNVIESNELSTSKTRTYTNFFNRFPIFAKILDL